MSENDTYAPVSLSLSTPMVTSSPPAGLARRLSEASRQVEALTLDGKHAFHGYSYPTIAQVREHANRALAQAGIAIIPSIVRVGRTERTGERGKPVSVTFIELQFTIASDDGAWTVHWFGESEDTSDKGVPKAVSAALKSFLATMLLMPVAEPENDDGEVELQAARIQPEAVKRSPPPAAPTPGSCTLPSRPLPPEQVRTAVQAKARRGGQTPATAPQKGALRALFGQAAGVHGMSDDNLELIVLHYTLGLGSVEELTEGQAQALLDWLRDKNKPGAILHPDARAELAEVVGRELAHLEGNDDETEASAPQE